MSKAIDQHIKDGSRVISIEHGVGRMIGCFILYDCIDDFIEVKFDSGIKNQFFCIKHKNDFRILSSMVDLQFALEELNALLIGPAEYIVNTQESESFLSKSSLSIVIETAILLRNSKITQNEKLNLESLLSSLALEISTVFEVDLATGRGILADYLKAA